jgi:predicted aspartyl protease
MARHQFPPYRPDPKDLERFGSRLEIEVGPPNISGGKKDTSTSQHLQKFTRMPALIDTGASRTVLTPLAIEKLNLPLIDYTTLSRAGGIDRAAVYVASIQFPRYRLTPIEVIQVLCCELPDQPIQCLIGRDILSRWQLTYNGQTGEWSIEDVASLPVSSTAPKSAITSQIARTLVAPSLAVPPWVEPPSYATSYDIFVSHASEDKAFVEPLVSALKEAGMNVWYDRDRMQWGDNLRSSIDEGLLNSRFGIVVLSKAFLKKKRWTEHELNGLFAKERAGEKVILPIWHKITQDDLAGYSTAFIDRIALDSQKNSIDEIVRSLKSLLGRKL